MQLVADNVVEAARRGEPSALTALLTTARPALRRYAERSCFVSDVEDAVQEALFALSRHVGRLRYTQALSTWMFRVVRRQCHSLARVTLRFDPWDDARTDRVVEGVSEEGLRLQVAAALESLPEHYRQIVMLRDFEELTVAEIAIRLNLSTAATKSRLHRARALVREFLVA
jgi:RNA polymerase sigma factor (sigma-70 family)